MEFNERILIKNKATLSYNKIYESHHISLYVDEIINIPGQTLSV